MNKVGPLKNQTVKSGGVGGREGTAGARNFLIARNSAAEGQDGERRVSEWSYYFSLAKKMSSGKKFDRRRQRRGRGGIRPFPDLSLGAPGLDYKIPVVEFRVPVV